MWESLTILVGGIATLAIYSFLIKENAVYRFFEHLFIGIAAGLGAILAVKNFLWPKIFIPLLGLDIIRFPDGTLSKPYDPIVLLYLIPIFFGSFFYLIYSPRFSWMAKLVFGFTLGASGGLAFKGFFNEMMPQIINSFKPLVVIDDGVVWLKSLENIVFIFTLLSVMYYFFFSFRFESKSLRFVSSSGRWLMMVCFGAFFGSTVMARMALLVERLQFLINDWWSIFRF